jgi:hypothetical protein
VLLWIFFEPARQCQVVIASVFDASVFDASVFDISVFDTSVFDASAFDALVFDTWVFDTGVFAVEGVGSTDTTGVRTTKSGGGSLSAFGSGSGSAPLATLNGGAASGTARASRLVLTIRRAAIISRPIEPRPMSRNT